MKTEIENIKKEEGKVVFRLDLIPEAEEDKEALASLESDEWDVTDQMIMSIVNEKVDKLLIAQGKEWAKERVEKKKGHSSFFIHLRLLKLASVAIDYPDSDVGAEENKEIEDIILFHLYRVDGKFNDEDITNVPASFGLKVSYDKLKSICEKLGWERKIVWRESAKSIIAKMIFAGSKYANDHLFPLTVNQVRVPFDQLSFYLSQIKLDNEFETQDIDNGEGVLVKYVPKGKYSDHYIRIVRIKFLFYSVISSPSIEVANRKNFDSVEKAFIEWVNEIRNEINSPSIPNFSEAKGVLLLEGATNFQFRNDNVKPSLNVEAQVNVFFKLLKAIAASKNESGLLLGIFGKWGRGKTFLWNQLVKKFSSKDQIEFDYLEFHAWKYQDTPASWAYLYELFATKYYKIDRKILWVISANFWNRIKLNLERLGHPKFYGILSLFLFGVFWYFVLGIADKLDLITKIVGSIGLSTIVSGLLFYHTFSGLAKDFFKSYFSEISFRDLLGIQAEIQKELVILLRVWIQEKQVGFKRLILFVDDIDRCDESRIIEIVDSLKIMIDNPEISKRVIVVAAIDEVVLKRAIKQKYFSMVKNDLSLSEEEKKNELEQLCREYLDKLFVNGFRLSSLTDDEKIAFFKDLTQEQTFYRKDKEGSVPTITEVYDGLEKVGDRTTLQTTKDIKSKVAYDDYIALQPNDKFELMDYEAEKLHKALLKYREVTPRSLRIYYYRYLLAREFFDLTIGDKNSIKYLEWQTNDDQKVLLPYLLVAFGREKSHADLLMEIKITETKPPGIIDVSCLGEKFRISKDLYLSLLKIVEIVVPY